MGDVTHTGVDGDNDADDPGSSVPYDTGSTQADDRRRAVEYLKSHPLPKTSGQ